MRGARRRAQCGISCLYCISGLCKAELVGSPLEMTLPERTRIDAVTLQLVRRWEIARRFALLKRVFIAHYTSGDQRWAAVRKIRPLGGNTSVWQGFIRALSRRTGRVSNGRYIQTNGAKDLRFQHLSFMTSCFSQAERHSSFKTIRTVATKLANTPTSYRCSPLCLTLIELDHPKRRRRVRPVHSGDHEDAAPVILEAAVCTPPLRGAGVGDWI